MTQLSVNVDHVATLRQARGVTYPDPVEAAHLAEKAGATGITVHLRGDRRHIQDSDVELLRRHVRGKLNLEIAARDEMLAIAEQLRPDQVTLVPERPEEITTEGGLDLVNHKPMVAEAAQRLAVVGIDVSLFLDPQAEVIAALAGLDGAGVSGFELNTDRYTKPESDTVAELSALAAAATQGRDLGFSVYAGHGLTIDNVGSVARLEPVEELNIGHSIVSRSVLIGMEQAVTEMLAAIDD